MTKWFDVTIQFDMNNKDIVENLGYNFKKEAINPNGIMVITYHGNSRSTTENVAKSGMPKQMTMQGYVKGGYKIIKVEERKH